MAGTGFTVTRVNRKLYRNQRDTCYAFQACYLKAACLENLSSWKQMGKFSSLRLYNHEFAKWILQVPTASPAKQTFHFMQFLKVLAEINSEKIDLSTLQSATQIADRMDNAYSRSTSSFGF